MNDILKKRIIGGLVDLEQGAFEALCSLLLPRVTDEYVGLEPNNKLTKTRNGTPDAFKVCEDGKYIAFQYTTQQDNIRAKIIKDIQAVRQSSVGKSTRKLVICCNTPILAEDHASFVAEVQSYGWDFDIFTVHKIAHYLLNHPDYCLEFLRIQLPATVTSGINTTDALRLYDAGEQIRIVREDLDLKPSEFIEVIDFHSEKALKSLESGESECDLQVLEKISEVIGVRMDWLKHQRGERYQVGYLPYFTAEDSIKRLKELNPSEIYFITEYEGYEFGIVARKEYKYHIYNTGINLAFWTWIDDLAHIPGMIRYLRELETLTLFHIESAISIECVLSPEDYTEVFGGNMHPIQAINRKLKHQSYWLESLLSREHSDNKRLKQVYGDWIIKSREAITKYVKID